MEIAKVEEKAAEKEKCLYTFETGKHEYHGLHYTHYANSRISIPHCPSCGWVDTEAIIKDVLEKFTPGLVDRKVADKMADALKLTYEIPELNPSNYTHEEVCELNSKVFEVWEEQKAALDDYASAVGEKKEPLSPFFEVGVLDGVRIIDLEKYQFHGYDGHELLKIIDFAKNHGYGETGTICGVK